MSLFTGETLTSTRTQLIRIEGFANPETWKNLHNSLRGPLSQFSSPLLICCNVGINRSGELKDVVEKIYPHILVNRNVEVGYNDIDITAIHAGNVTQTPSGLLIPKVDSPFNRLLIASSKPDEHDYVDNLMARHIFI